MKYCSLLLVLMVFPVLLFSQEVGSKAPDFSAADLNGNKIVLSELTGRVIVLDFWASWCIPCKKSMPHLAELFGELKDSPFTIIAINLDEEKSRISSFEKSIGLEIPFPVIFDKDSKLPPIYNVEGMPTTVLIDKLGVIRFKETGFDSDTKQKMDKLINELLNK